MITKFRFISGDYDYEYFTNQILRRAVSEALTYAVEEYEYEMDTEMNKDNLSVALYYSTDFPYTNSYYIEVTDGKAIARESLNEWMIIVKEQLALAQAQGR